MTISKELREFTRGANATFVAAFVHGLAFAFTVGITIGAILFAGMVL